MVATFSYDPNKTTVYIITSQTSIHLLIYSPEQTTLSADVISSNAFKVFNKEHYPTDFVEKSSGFL
ncbi:hypothetical protein CAP50_00515 [Psychrobacter sp. L7]|nr:hypothetical protein CAP50_00515 [Psychrobacter sp. L7]